MAEGRPLKWVEAHKPQKGPSTLPYVCNMEEIPMGFRDLLRKRNAAIYQAYES